jgi:predicted MFS family arabinose efflux permease
MSKKYTIHFSKVLLALIANYASAFAWGLFAPLFALIVLDRGGTASEVGFLWGGYTLLTGVSMLLFGRLEDSKHSAKKMLVFGTFFQALASFILLIVDTNNGLIAAQFFFGIGFGMGVPALRVIYGGMLEKGRKATEWGLMDGGNMLIMSLAAVAGGYIYQYGSANYLYLCMLAAFLLSTMLFLLLIKSIDEIL